MAMVLSPAQEAFRMDFNAWLAQKAGSMLVKWTCLRDVVMKSGGFTDREATDRAQYVPMVCVL